MRQLPARARGLFPDGQQWIPPGSSPAPTGGFSCQARFKSGCVHSPARARGFTLLEVMVALTITGLALGGLFGVVAGNKRLAWRAEQALLGSMQVRNLINFTQLNDMRGDLDLDIELGDSGLMLDDDIELAVPERKTMGTTQALRAFEIRDASDAIVASGSYRVILDLPE